MRAEAVEKLAIDEEHHAESPEAPGTHTSRGLTHGGTLRRSLPTP